MALDSKPGAESKQDYEYLVNDLNSLSQVKIDLRNETYRQAGMWAIMLS